MANSHIRIRGGLQPVIFGLLALLAGVAPWAPELQARENAYDVLGKALVPIARVIIASPKMTSHALTATLVLDSATNLPAAHIGDSVDIALQSPDKLRLHATIAGAQAGAPAQSVTVCRDGQQLWANPGGQIDALIDAQHLPDADPDFKLTSFRLPVTEKQLVFLPLLFNAQDVGDEVVDGETCMVLDVTLMPQFAHAIKAENYSARLWVRPDYKLAKVELFRPQWHAVILVKSLAFVPSLPPETWQPTPDEAKDVIQLTAGRYKQLLDAVMARWTALKSEN
jgi:hypothetical protein